MLVAVCELMGIDMKPPVSFNSPTNIFHFLFSHFRPGQLLDWTIFLRRGSRSALIWMVCPLPPSSDYELVPVCILQCWPSYLSDHTDLWLMPYVAIQRNIRSQLTEIQHTLWNLPKQERNSILFLCILFSVSLLTISQLYPGLVLKPIYEYIVFFAQHFPGLVWKRCQIWPLAS